MRRAAVVTSFVALALLSPITAVARPATSAPATVAPVGNTGAGAPSVASTSFDLASVGYEQSEYFLSGTAASYRPTGPLAENGRWTLLPDGHAPYVTRLVVYRPIDPKRFDGTAIVEWLNVSGGVDAAPNWILGHVQEIRQGMAWIGVTTQQVGSRQLQRSDPPRYASLVHPGDQYSYDIYSQAGAAVRADSQVLSGLHAERLIGTGESQSAFFLTSYVNGVAPDTHAFDGYLIHSRAAFGAPFDGSSALKLSGSPVRIRTDLDVPVLVFDTETDVAVLGAASASQPDSTSFRDWEVAGTAHYDAYGLGVGPQDRGDGRADQAFFGAMTPSSQSPTNRVGACAKPVNAGPATYVLRAAIHDLNRWVMGGRPPPHGPRLVRDAARPTDLVRDGDGIARGGIRTPHVDAPVAVLTGTGQSGSGFCFLFGTTTPLSPATLAAKYPSHAAFVRAWHAATKHAVGAGFILPADAGPLEAAAARSAVGN